MKPRDAERSKNFFALGLVSWLYTRPTDRHRGWIEKRFAAKPLVKEANPAPSRPATTSARPPSSSSPPTRSARPSSIRGST